jgi:dTDP-4-dehydrorhamnose reductase
VDKVLVTGVDELVGANVAWTLADRCEIVALSRRGTAPADCRLLDCDADDPSDVARHIEAEAPRYVIHCGPLSRSAWDLADSPLADVDHEIRLALQMVEAAEQIEARLLVVTTDGLFAGPRMFHGEEARPAASGRVRDAALALEQALSNSSALVIRTHAYGWSPAGAEVNYAERFWNALSRGEPCQGDAERHATPILASDLAELIYKALPLRLQGRIHMTGAERTSPFRFAAALATAGGFAGRQVRVSDDEPRRGNVDETSLNTQLVRRQLGTPLPLLREGLARFVTQAANGYREKLEGNAVWAVVQSAAA